MNIPLTFAPANRPEALRVLPTRRILRPVSEPVPDPDEAPPTTTEPPAPLLRMIRGVATAIIEVTQGRRPMHQLAGVFDPDAQAVLSRLYAIKGVGEFSVRSLRAQMPSPRVVEVTLHLRKGARTAVAAFRMEPRAGGWRCSHLELEAANREITCAVASSSAWTELYGP